MSVEKRWRLLFPGRGKEIKPGEELTQVPKGYSGPGFLIDRSTRVSVTIDNFLGKKPEDNDGRNFYSISLSTENLSNRIEGPIPETDLFAKPRDIERFNNQRRAEMIEERRLRRRLWLDEAISRVVPKRNS